MNEEKKRKLVRMLRGLANSIQGADLVEIERWDLDVRRPPVEQPSDGDYRKYLAGPYRHVTLNLAVELTDDDDHFERYPMGDDQPAQIDCRRTDCVWHENAECTNAAPAITLFGDSGTCWSHETVTKSRIVNEAIDDLYEHLEAIPGYQDVPRPPRAILAEWIQKKVLGDE